MARPAGLEPAATRLEGGCSIQLSYGRMAGKSRRRVVGVEGFEPPTFCSQSRRATRLRYTPPFNERRHSRGAHNTHGTGLRQREIGLEFHGYLCPTRWLVRIAAL